MLNPDIDYQIPNWGWMLDREEHHGIPRLFRQSEAGDWSGVFAQVRSELEQYMVSNAVEGRQ